jgi:histone H3/H4
LWIYIDFENKSFHNFEKKMTENFSQSVLIKVVAQICQMVGFHKIMSSPLHILTDILSSFLIHLGQTAQHYAEHCGHSSPNLNDLSLAFFDFGLKPTDLLEFLRDVSPLPQCILVPKYPVAKDSVSATCEESQSSVERLCNENQPRQTLKIKISLSKIKAAKESKKNKYLRNKKKKKSKRNQP